MVEVEVENFQSIEKVSIRVDGFTALVGESNTGKSAIIRAIRCALTGAAGTSFVRHGARCERRLRSNKKCRCFAKVRVRTPALDFTWEKGDAVNRYTVRRDGAAEAVYEGVRGPPEFLCPEFEPVQLGPTADVVHIASQFEPIFLLDDTTGTVIADVLSDVARLDAINEAQRMVAKDRREAVATTHVREKDLLTLHVELREYEGLDAVVTRAGKLRGEADRTVQLGETLATLDRFLVSAAGLKHAMITLAAALRPEVPSTETIDRKSATFNLITRFIAEVRAKAPLVKRLTGIEPLRIPEVEGVKSKMSRLKQLTDWQIRVVDVAGKVRAGAELEQLPEVDTTDVPTRRDTLHALTRYSRKWEELSRQIVQCEEQLREVEHDEQEATAAVNALGVCPTCARGWEVDHGH